MRYFRILFLFFCLAWSLVHADQWHYSDVDRIVAIADIHGAYDALTETLQAADVIDSRLAWSGGKTHLVFTGDLLDRGAKSRQVMDLIMRLEKEARRRGGRVHLLLGNHEVMNLNGDLRYVADTEYAAFEDMESSRVREASFNDFLASKPEGGDESAIRAEFDALAPPGYFGHRRAFRYTGKYGKWLLKKPFIVVVNETAFVHGGLPTFIAEYGLEGANDALKKDLRDYVRLTGNLTDRDILNPVYRFKELPALLNAKREAGQIPWKLQESVQVVIDFPKSPLNTPIGPTWYRGTAACSALVEGDVLASAFAKIGANRVAMGHTSTVTRQVQQRAEGSTVELDTGMLHSVYKGSGNALIIEGDRLTVTNQDGRSGLSPIEHPIRVGHESIPLDDDGLAAVLSTGSLVELLTEEEPRRLVQVTSGELTVVAHFRESQDNSQDSSFSPELAAYKLDRMLGLGMVPVTIRRDLDGQQGTLQLVAPGAVSDAELAGMKSKIGAPCSFDKQEAAMRIFDALIDNLARTPSTMLYDPEDLLLMLVDHSASFGNGTAQPGHSFLSVPNVNMQWQTVLRELDDDTMRTELGDVLDEQQLTALEQRRDAMLSNSDD